MHSGKPHHFWRPSSAGDAELGADGRNRTCVITLATCGSAIELHPRIGAAGGICSHRLSCIAEALIRRTALMPLASSSPQLAPRDGIEPPTHGFGDRRSTAELPRYCSMAAAVAIRSDVADRIHLPMSASATRQSWVLVTGVGRRSHRPASPMAAAPVALDRCLFRGRGLSLAYPSN